MNIWEIHPALVHFPIALLLSGVVLDLVGWWRGSAIMIRSATWLLIAGVATGVVATNFGLLAFYTVPAHTEEAHRLMYWHLGMASASLVLFIWVALSRWFRRATSPSMASRGIGLIAAATLGVAGYLGGVIVYHGGAGIDPKLLATAVREGHSHGGGQDHAQAKPDIEGMKHEERNQPQREGKTKSPHGENGKAHDEARHGHGKERATKGDSGKPQATEQEMKGMQHADMSGKSAATGTGQFVSHEHEQKTASESGDKGGKPPTAGDENQEHKGHESKESKAVAKGNEHGKPADTEEASHEGHDKKGKKQEAPERETTGEFREPRKLKESPTQFPRIPPPDPKAAEVPPGYRIEVALQDLTYPTSVEFDADGVMYVAEGGYIYGDDVAPARILRVSSQGKREVVADQLSGPVTDLLWHDGRLFISHRGKISVLESGSVRDLLSDLPSLGDHHNNQMTIGPDGKLYFGQGTATNSGVVGLDNFKIGWLARHPTVHDVSAKDIRLRTDERIEGNVQQFEAPNLLALLADSSGNSLDGKEDEMEGMDHTADGKHPPGSEAGGQRGGKPAEPKKDVKGMKGMDHGEKGKRPEKSMKGMEHGSKGKMPDMKGMDHGAKGKMPDMDMSEIDHSTMAPKLEMATTGPFQPFGKRAPPDGTVRGETKANGTILRMSIDGSNLEVYAWGLRNPFGVMWRSDGKLYASDNGYDERGSRPIAHAPDSLWEIREGGWYGFPDYAAGIPVTDPQFRPKNGPLPKFLLRDHPASERPVLTLPAHVGAAKIAIGSNAAFGFRGQLFLALSGDMNPITGTHTERSGFEVIRIDVEEGKSETFFKTKKTALGPKGMEYVATAGPRRPVDVQFSSDGSALYVVDVGAMAILPTATGPVPRPFPGSGIVWRITRDISSPPISGQRNTQVERRNP